MGHALGPQRSPEALGPWSALPGRRLGYLVSAVCPLYSDVFVFALVHFGAVVPEQQLWSDIVDFRTGLKREVVSASTGWSPPLRPVPGLAALRRAWVGRGVFVAGGFHPKAFALELLPRRRQGLVHCAQNVGRLGLAEEDISPVTPLLPGDSRRSRRARADQTFPGAKNDFISGGR